MIVKYEITFKEGVPLILYVTVSGIKYHIGRTTYRYCRRQGPGIPYVEESDDVHSFVISLMVLLSPCFWLQPETTTEMDGENSEKALAWLHSALWLLLAQHRRKYQAVVAASI